MAKAQKKRLYYLLPVAREKLFCSQPKARLALTFPFEGSKVMLQEKLYLLKKLFHTLYHIPFHPWDICLQG
jgi:hypothetical protein